MTGLHNWAVWESGEVALDSTQIAYPGSRNFDRVWKDTDRMSNNRVSEDKLQHLAAQAIETLEALLNSRELSPKERADVAFKILEMTGTLPSVKVSQPTGLATNGAAANHATSTVRSATVSEVNGSQTAVAQLATQPRSQFLQAQYIRIDNFLSPQDNARALEIALSHAEEFVATTTTTKAANYRQSSVLYATLFPEFYDFLQQKILKTLPSVLDKLQHPSFPIAKVEMQLTAHNDGCFYKVHNDAGSENTATRELTYVYYFNGEPQKYSGGELRLYDTQLQGNAVIGHEKSKTIEPANNSIVFFNSRCRHEVMPVSCPSQKFEDSRFTLNGWVRRM
ncbi:MAG: 2OG-Fe(II) oxygenase [Cyanobacteriota bacterium]|nr:2OG-Fe(II) oxygenase [Cyanobacteriota bacterium]